MGLGAREPVVDAVQRRADRHRRVVAALDYSGSGEIPAARCGLDRDRPRRLPRNRPAPRNRRLLAIRLGAAAIFYLRLLSDPRSLASRYFLRNTGSWHRLDALAPGAAARSRRTVFLRGVADLLLHSVAWPRGRATECKSRSATLRRNTVRRDRAAAPGARASRRCQLPVLRRKYRLASDRGSDKSRK